MVTIPGSEGMANAIVNFVNYGVTILVIMFVIEAVKLFGKLFSGPAKWGAEKSNVLGGKLSKFIPGTKKNARRVHQRILSEYINEEREVKQLDEATRQSETTLSRLEAIQARGNKFEDFGEMTSIRNDIRDFGKKIREVKGYFRRLGRSTFRAQSKLNQLMNYYIKKGIEVPESIKILENTILDLHQKTKDEVQEVENAHKNIMGSPEMEGLANLKANQYPQGPIPIDAGVLNFLIKSFKASVFELKNAYKHQQEAERSLAGIIAEIKGLYK